MEPQPCLLKGKLRRSCHWGWCAYISYISHQNPAGDVGPHYNHRNWTISLVKPMGIPANPGGTQPAPETWPAKSPPHRSWDPSQVLGARRGGKGWPFRLFRLGKTWVKYLLKMMRKKFDASSCTFSMLLGIIFRWCANDLYLGSDRGF
jgi:hypothetical protein